MLLLWHVPKVCVCVCACVCVCVFTYRSRSVVMAEKRPTGSVVRLFVYSQLRHDERQQEVIRGWLDHERQQTARLLFVNMWQKRRDVVGRVIADGTHRNCTRLSAAKVSTARLVIRLRASDLKSEVAGDRGASMQGSECEREREREREKEMDE